MCESIEKEFIDLIDDVDKIGEWLAESVLDARMEVNPASGDVLGITLVLGTGGPHYEVSISGRQMVCRVCNVGKCQEAETVSEAAGEIYDVLEDLFLAQLMTTLANKAKPRRLYA